MSMINKLTDRMLGKLVGNCTAKAGCLPETFYRYETHAGMRCWRKCQVHKECGITCGGLNCPV